MQSNASPAMIQFFVYVSLFSDSTSLYFNLFMIFVFGKRERAVYYGTLGFLHLLFAGILKDLYHTPRPFMVSSNIAVYDCTSGFGLPSGHASGAA